MVHALEKIRPLLRPDGRLIDIHPSGEPPPIEVHVGSQATYVGRLEESDDFIEYGRADAAVAQAVQRGLFTLEKEGAFPFVTHADSVADLREYLAKEWKDAIIEEAVVARAKELLSTPGRDRDVTLRERVRIARLRPQALPSG